MPMCNIEGMMCLTFAYDCDANAKKHIHPNMQKTANTLLLLLLPYLRIYVCIYATRTCIYIEVVMPTTISMMSTQTGKFKALLLAASEYNFTHRKHKYASLPCAQM
eukprot:GHVS01107752.1.p2 GENE.GHVS01107752.1~~GHVS01107752.1.p2  ORF type:complete len:106 (-),score=7.08 GHVS01107752.1:327-644(-)